MSDPKQDRKPLDIKLRIPPTLLEEIEAERAEGPGLTRSETIRAMLWRARRARQLEAR